MMGRGLFDEFFSILHVDNIFRVFINEALIEYDTRFVLNTVATEESSLRIFNGHMPRKIKTIKGKKRDKINSSSL